LLPTACAHKAIGAHESARARQDQAKGDFRHGIVEHAGGVAYPYAQLGGFAEIYSIYPNAKAGDQL
jgi:hypothetical protein